MSMFQRATRQQVPLKLGITGPSGSGKTTAALRLARGLIGNAPLALVDTENGSASLYADETEFDVVNMNPPYTVAKFTKVVTEATAAGYKALIIDSASAEWTELLTEKETMDARGGNGFANWGAITKKHEDFLKAVRNASIHLILCLRAKQEHVQDKDAAGKTTIRKVGMAAVQRDGMEYELTTVFDIAMDHSYKVSKDRTRLFDGRMEMINVATGQELAAWLSSGAPLAENTGEPLTPAPATAAAPANPPQAPATAPTAAAPTTTKTSTATTAEPPARPTQAAPASPATTGLSKPFSPAAPARTAPSEPPAEWVDAMVELGKVSLGMPEKTRAKLVASFEAEGPASLPALLAEVEMIRSVNAPKTVGAVLAQLPPTPGPAIPQDVATFVNSVDPDTDEAAGGIDEDQYGALNALILAHGLNRDALRAYCSNAKHLLPCKNGPTLARMTAEAFQKLRDRLNNTKPHPEGGTWSARTVAIINATPTTPYQPMSAAS